MPQLDIATYFSQFAWLLLSLIMLYFIITTWFLPSFKNNFIIRKSLGGGCFPSGTESLVSPKQLVILNTLNKL